MSPGRDAASNADALSWGGDEDPTLDAGVRAKPVTEPATESSVEPVEPNALPDGYTALGRGSGEVGRIAADGTVTMPGDRVPMSSATLITFGVLGGVYLLYAVGWLLGGLRLQGRAQYLVTDIMFQGSLWLAVLAPLLWFGTVFLITARSKPWLRLVWLIGGAVLLVPWPFIMLGAVGQ